MNIHVAGENALIVYFAESVSAEVSANIEHMCYQLKPYLGKELIDLVPSYASVLVLFDPLKTDHLQVRKWIRYAQGAHFEESTTKAKNIVRLPVYYAGPDLHSVAQQHNLSAQDVIDIHTQKDYDVYAIGFAPGFAYLGQLDSKIKTPRLATPRKKVPKGAVAIADLQTAVYPKQSPGGWNLIGYCPMAMFDTNKQPPMPMQSGDKVQFYAIDENTFLDMGGELPQGEVV